MCGIAGAIARSATLEIGPLVARLTDALAHRGPDGGGFWSPASPEGTLAVDELSRAATHLALGHRRLAIVDPAHGAQPLSNEDGSVWVSFNGEIFNAPGLRASLEREGHHFRTRTDTEVLVHGWEAWGEALMERLNGMFAFALHDRRTGTTILARDPIGVKPLYIGASRGLTWWSSELGPATADLVGGVSPEGLALFLSFRFVPSPGTIYRDCWKLPPSHFVRLERDSAGEPPVFIPYQTRIRSTAAPRGRGEWREALMSTLEQAVVRQLMSDVPVGSLLSGGVDSSIVTHHMYRHLPMPPESFAVGFASHGASAEVLNARRAAQALGVPLRELLVADEEYLAEWPASFARTGEPVANASSLLLGAVCRLASRTHRVVLTGQGADEPLGGYPRHVAERLYQLGRRWPRLAAIVAQQAMGRDAGRRLVRVLSERDRAMRFAQILAVLPFEIVDRMVGRVDARALASEVVARWIRPAAEDSTNELLRVDARLSLSDDLLLVADHFSMAASVELRVPFLDLEFFELAERMPSRYKISPIGERKWLYRQGAARVLPSELARALCGLRARVGRKQGFSTPSDHWLVPHGPVARELDRRIDGLVSRELLGPAGAGLARELVNSGRDQRQVLSLYALSQWAEA